jgi:YD repeat-containing protein
VLRNTATTYTLTGKPATLTDANGNTTGFADDALDRLAAVRDAANRVTSYGYDALSRQVSITNFAIQASPLLRKSFNYRSVNNCSARFRPSRWYSQRRGAWYRSGHRSSCKRIPVGDNDFNCRSIARRSSICGARRSRCGE